MSSSSSTTKICCFNPDCKETKSDRSFRKAWRLRSGDFAELCDRCATAYEEGRYCEVFHINAAGWRSCESCRKPLHCGCIVSITGFILLDAGGVECMPCARKHTIVASNQCWSQAPLHLSERLKDISMKNWGPSSVANGTSGQWWHSANARNIGNSQSELQARLAYEFDRSNGLERRFPSERPSVPCVERVLRDQSERVAPRSDVPVQDRLSNRSPGGDMVVSLHASRREEGTVDGLQDSCHLPGESSSAEARKGLIVEPRLNNSGAVKSFDAVANSRVNMQSSSGKDLLVPSNEANGSACVSGTQSQRQTPPTPLGNQCHGDSQNGGDSYTETQIRNGKARGDARGRNQLLPRYWPKITDQELQQISVDSNKVITPLFEKTLSASDAGRIGRLVLPKKCAEAYFPTISQPEGVPLKVQDAKGSEWVFQFRFWPNNNSRMYVLEGVTPCIQNMSLQAGDIVTFSRLDPDGKLVMGSRKPSEASPSSQDNRKSKTGNGVSKLAESNLKDANTWSEVDKSGYIAKDALRAQSSVLPSKRKSSTLGLKSKRLQIENEDRMELKLTWEEAQGLLRPTSNHVPIVVVVEGHEFEEYEEAPILGKPTIFTTNNSGENIQWAQCEECSKWRKLPVDALLPSKWTCSDNLWDAKRSSCSSDQEITDGQLQDLLSSSNSVSSKKIKSVKKDSDSVEGSEGLDTLANLAILAEVEALPSSIQPPTTKHPRHRPGCSCIVCIQPPSGKGPKHSDTCTCNVCVTVRRRFRTLMERRGKRPPENEAGTSRKKQNLVERVEPVDGLPTSSNTNSGVNPEMVVDGNADDDISCKKASSPFKGGIDLNIQPEREDESSPVSGSGSIRFVRDTPDLFHKQKLASSSRNRDVDTSGGSTDVGVENHGIGITQSCDPENGEMNPPAPLPTWIPATTGTG
ncbi:B3 domain-containing protein [Thalictrum thalictroides]|uniref:B3 domain-containing protein n=1 Tax=Thalictrum thalictroides TaxID=46969 RepID=A0A7J6VN89_THATH|nr:B3 domain-containing protein [Thalictrum thalictroides]